MNPKWQHREALIVEQLSQLFIILAAREAGDEQLGQLFYTGGP